ncbi:unnamed protein product [Amoebophrya sp. A120]|nr:unnamed protein product [Amoebophrya sp. A120]|eukprot:GSA120T00009074001.1
MWTGPLVSSRIRRPLRAGAGNKPVKVMGPGCPVLARIPLCFLLTASQQLLRGLQQSGGLAFLLQGGSSRRSLLLRDIVAAYLAIPTSRSESRTITIIRLYALGKH